MACNLCFASRDIAFQLSSAEGIRLKARQIIHKYFGFCLKDADTDDEESICERCWKTVNDFHDFYLFVECHHMQAQVRLSCVTPVTNADVKVEEVANVMKIELDPSSFAATTTAGGFFDENHHQAQILGIDDIKIEPIISDTDANVNQPNPAEDQVDDKWDNNFFDIGNGNSDPDYHPSKERRERPVGKSKSKKTVRKYDFVCEACGKDFATQTWHDKHFDVAHNTLPYECDFCGETFRFKGRLRTHMRKQHMRKNEPTPCEICGKILKSWRRLLAHKRMQHSTDGKTRYQCHFCGKGFAMHEKLREHISIHTGTLPLQCPQCDKRFRFSSSLSLHKKRVHSDFDMKSQKFKCHFCDNVYSSASSRYIHRKRHHPDKNARILNPVKLPVLSVQKQEPVAAQLPAQSGWLEALGSNLPAISGSTIGNLL